MSLVSDVYLKLIFKDGQTLNVKADNYLKSYSALFEMDNSLQSIVGSISANELMFSLNNSSGIFTPSNVSSPYYGLLDDKIKVEVIKGVERKGVFYVADWNSPNTASNKSTTVRAVDRLQSVLNTPVGVLGMDSGISVKDYLVKIFLEVGFTSGDLEIDPTLEQVLDYTVTRGNNLASVLNDISISADCYIYINENDKVIARKKEFSGISKHTLSGSTNITGVTVGNSLKTNANVCVVGFNSTMLSDVKEVLAIKGYKVAKGLSSINNYEVSGGNLYEVDNVKIVTSYDIEAVGVTCSQNTISLDVLNHHSEEVTCDITVYGKTVDLSSSYVERRDDELIAKNGRKEMKIDGKLITTESQAKELVDILWERINLPVPNLFVNVVSNGFEYLLGDLLEVEATSLNSYNQGYVHSVRYDWLGGDYVKANVGVRVL